jgi:hypothetical protein
VWDTVDAVDLPFHIGDFWNRVVYQFKFERISRPSSIRRTTRSRLTTRGVRTRSVGETNDHGRVEQVWFAGVR